MSIKRLRVAIVGGGPAGLSCALALSGMAQLFDVHLYERGRSQRARTCPVDLGFDCRGCKGICNVISGNGGAMHYGDSIKISGYPSGRRLFDLLGAERYWHVQEQALQIFGLTSSDLDSSPEIAFHGRKLRQYPIAEVEAEALAEIINVTFERLRKNSVTIHQRRTISDISRLPSGRFHLSVEGTSTPEISDFDRVVFATGRAGFASTDRLLGELGVGKISPLISIGARLELPSRLLNPLYNAHKDFKFSELHEGYKVKSFCFSNHKDQGGRLKYCHYQNQFHREVVFLDGHSNISKSSRHTDLTPKGNFALLVQLPSSFDLEWLDHKFVENYYNTSKGKPVFEAAASFLGGIDIGGDVKPSVDDCRKMEVASLFPEPVVSSLQSACSAVLETIALANQSAKDEVARVAIVVAPEVEFFWPSVSVNPSFETNVSGLYVIGDSAGIAQGNLQAAISGLIAAHDIIGAI